MSPLPPAGVEAFEPLGEITLIDGPLDDALALAELLLVRAERLDETLLSAAPALRAIARTGAGLDAIDLDAVSRRRIPLIYAPDAGALPTAEGALTLIVASMKRLGELGTTAREGRWRERYGHDILDIAGATLGVVGFGRIGGEVARLADALGMNVIAYDPRREAITAGAAAFPVSAVPLAELFATADVITLHCPLNDQTRGLVDKDLIATTKRGAILVNASRGAVVAGNDVLLRALDSGQLSGVALDVFAVEPPPPGSPILAHPRVICTPHAIGLSRDWNRKVFASLARDVARLFGGRRPRHVANPEVLDSVGSAT